MSDSAKSKAELSGAISSIDGPDGPSRGIDGQVNRSQVVEAVKEAIIEGRLPPGAKLTEEQISRSFAASRAVVRDALIELNAMGLVNALPNRGAFVARPSVEEARDIYDARRSIENIIVNEFVRNCTARDIRVLRDHIELQRRTYAAGRKDQFIRQLSEFHVVLARLNGNSVLADILERLVTWTSLMATIYRSQDGCDSCGIEEHEKLIDLLAAGKADESAELMRNHLSTRLDRVQSNSHVPRVDIQRALRAGECPSESTES